MANDCNHECDGCPSSGNCEEQAIKKLQMVEGSSAKKIIGVISGKGGVGKSFVTSYLATCLARKGYKVGILDGDITGPSIPYAFGMKDKALGTETAILPRETKTGIKIISSNMLLENDEDPIIWRGPMIGSLVSQFYNEVYWEELDFLLIDMPPGTGDVALTAFQSIPIDSLVLVATPQGLVNMIVEKAAKMATMMHIKIDGLVTNMSYVTCPDCGKRIDIYGESKVGKMSREYNIPVSIEIPFDPKTASAVDSGTIEDLDANYLDALVEFYTKDIK